MADQNNVYSNAILTATLDQMYQGISGLYEVAIDQNTKYAGLTDQVVQLSTFVTGGVDSINATLNNLRTDLDTQREDRGQAIAQVTNTISVTSTALNSALTAAVQNAHNEAVEISNNVSTLSTNLETNYYTKTDIDTKVASVFKWMGTAESLQSLSSITDKAVGHVYQVGSTEYAWTGSVWEQLGLNVDMSLYATVSALNDETTARTEAIKNINGQIETITGRVTDLEDIIPLTLATSGALLTEVSGKTVLNAAYNPGIALQFNGKSIGSGITSLNFAGTTTITVGDDGVAKVQIGENMNSSAWNTKDGKNGDGTPSGFPAGASIIIPDATGATFKVGNWTAGSTQNVGTTSSSITVKSTGVIHMDEGINTWVIKVYGATGNVLVEANVNDTVAYNNSANPTSATVTASAISYITGTTGITHTVSSGAIEPNYPAAVGGCAQVSFAFDLTKIDEIKNGGRFSIEISGCGGTYKSSERFYIAGQTPAITSASLTFNNNQSTKTVSGVKYIKGGTYTLTTGNITNLNNQAGVSTRIAITATGDFSDEDTSIASNELSNFSNAYNNICTYTDSGLTLGSNLNKQGTAVSVTLTPKNAKGSGTAVTASANGLNINTFAETDSTASTESFYAENMRLTTALETWSSAAVLGDQDLQVIPGVGLVYPTINYSTIALPENNPNYSTCSGTRYFVRKMTAGSGTVFGGILTLAGLGSNWSKLEFAKISIDGGANWYNLKADRGGADATGVLNSYTSNTGAISFTFPGTTSMTATDGVYIKLGWSDTTVKITSITLSM